jgi:L,D-transpeptidase catalytic domain
LAGLISAFDAVKAFSNYVPCPLLAGPVSSAPAQPQLPRALLQSIRRHDVRPTRFILTVTVASQSMRLFERSNLRPSSGRFPNYHFRRRYCVSTSAYGVGQVNGSNQTPLGLHRVAEKIGAGAPIGTVFRSRQALGLTWQGFAPANVVHRILWLEGLEPGRNRGGRVDSYRRYIYIHGFGDETTLGRPQSHGCIHVAAKDLLPLFDVLPTGSLVWIAER